MFLLCSGDALGIALKSHQYDWIAIQARYDQHVSMRTLVVEFGCAWLTIQRARDMGLFVPRGKNDIKVSRIRNIRRKKNGLCHECDKPLKSKYSAFCSNKCKNQDAAKAYIERWLSGHETGTTEKGYMAVAVRNYMLKECEYTCSVIKCRFIGFNPVTGNSVIQVDHIDGNSLNNTYRNLRCICPNCHSLTPNFVRLNAGKGRESRNIARIKKKGKDRFIRPKLVTNVNN